MTKLRKIVLGFGYLISAVIIIFGTYFLVRLAQGNAFDIVTGKLKPTGLLLLDSIPQGAQISFNGKTIKAKTPTRITNIDPGAIRVQLSKNGYRTWYNSNEIIAGQVTFLTYALFVPNQVPVNALLTNLSPAGSLQTKDHKHSFISVKSPAPAVYATDNFASANQIYAPPVPSDPNARISDIALLSASDDGANLLIRQTSAAGAEYVVVDGRGGNPATNLNQVFRITGASLQFNPDNSNELIWLDGNVIRKINLSNRTIGAVLAEHVTYVTVSNHKLYFVAVTEAGRSLLLMDLNGQHQSTVLANIEDSPSYQIQIARNNGVDYLVMLVGKTNRLSIYRDVSGSASPRVGDVLENVTAVTIDRNEQYVDFVQAGTLVSYVLERNIYQRHNAALTDLRNWQWADDHHLAVITGQSVRLLDFDGQNDQVLYGNPALDAQLVMANRNPVIVRPNPAAAQFATLFITDKKQ